MPSSGYAAWSVVADEQPTTAKWNILGSNDAAFNNGNGFEDNIIINRHIANGAIAPRMLALLANSGRYVYATQSGNFTSDTAIGSSFSFTVPTGCTKVLIIGFVRLQSQDATLKDMQVYVRMDGTTDTRTSIFTATASFAGAHIPLVDEIAAAAGAHTFQVRSYCNAGAMNAGNYVFYIIPLFS